MNRTTTLIIAAILVLLVWQGESQAQTRPRPQAKTPPNTEKKTITMSQAPQMHGTGGWEKGPSQWYTSAKYPVEFRTGMLLLNHGANSYARHIITEIRFKEAGSIEVTANSHGRIKAGANGWQTLCSNEKGKIVKANIIIKEDDFDRTAIIFLRDFKPYVPLVVN